MPLKPPPLVVVVRAAEVGASWTAAAGNGFPVLNYRVVVEPATGGEAVHDELLPEAARSLVVGGLTTGSSYVLRVSGVNELGQGEMRSFGPFEATGVWHTPRAAR